MNSPRRTVSASKSKRGSSFGKFCLDYLSPIIKSPLKYKAEFESMNKRWQEDKLMGNSTIRKKVKLTTFDIFNEESENINPHENNPNQNDQKLEFFKFHQKRSIKQVSHRPIPEFKISDFKNHQSIVQCKCSKSMCIKHYCDCFAKGVKCGELCSCTECKNRDEKPMPSSQKKKRKNGNGCHCKKSNCLKKYCECYLANKKCLPDCGCTNCENGSKELPRKINLTGNFVQNDKLLKKLSGLTQ